MRTSRSTRPDEFVPKSEIDDLYLVRPYYIVPDGKIGHEVALAQVVLTNREHIIALQARGKGLLGTLLCYPYEVRGEEGYFDDIQDVKVKKDMLIDLAKHIVETKSGSFEPERFEDHCESALINRKKAGQRIGKQNSREQSNVIDQMDALRQSLKKDANTARRSPGTAPARAAKKASRSTRARKAS